MDQLTSHLLKDTMEIQMASKTALQEVLCGGFQKCYEQPYEWWQNCVTASGQYSEANYI
jgi:hypothetical protein